MSVLVFAEDSGAIDRRIRELYLQGVKVKEIPNEMDAEIGPGSVRRRITVLRRQGLLPYRMVVRVRVKEEAREEKYECERCHRPHVTEFGAKVCCASREEIGEILRGFWP